MYLSVGLHEDVKSAVEAYSPQKRTSSTSKHDFFSFLWFFFALLDPDLDSHSQFGSGSTFQILTLSGSNLPKAMQILWIWIHNTAVNFNPILKMFRQIV
jgi:hypothetical protein